MSAFHTLPFVNIWKPTNLGKIYHLPFSQDSPNEDAGSRKISYINWLLCTWLHFPGQMHHTTSIKRKEMIKLLLQPMCLDFSDFENKLTGATGQSCGKSGASHNLNIKCLLVLCWPAPPHTTSNTAPHWTLNTEHWHCTKHYNTKHNTNKVSLLASTTTHNIKYSTTLNTKH